VRLFRNVQRNEWFSPAKPIWVRYHDAGHLLGSNFLEVEIRDRTPPLRVLFSGDVGRYDGPLYHDPLPPVSCDYLVCEATYGDRDHPPGSILDALADVISRAERRGGVMLMAAFAVGRAQQLIYLLQVLKHEGRIPDLPIYIDSPMACDATSVYREHREDHDLSEGELDDANPVLAGPSVHLCRSTDESKALNHITGPAIFISSSGMMDAGRIVHHLKYRLPSERNTIVIGGYMAPGSRGRLLQEGAKYLRMHGQQVAVRASIEKVPGLSGHADRSHLLRWLAPLARPKHTFLVHCEPQPGEAFAAALQEQRGWEVSLPEMGETCELT
jgi:metallo-beta-lactamase family protein